MKFKKVLATYWDDILMVAGEVCLTAPVAGRFGSFGGLLTAGVCFVVDAVLVGKAKRGGH